MSSSITVLLLVTALVVDSAWGDEDDSPGAMATFLQELLTRDAYDSRVRPGPQQGNRKQSYPSPTIVDVDVYFNSISSINDFDMDYSGQVFLRQRWTDPRLAFTEYNHSIFLTYQQFSLMWVPDLFVTNEKAGYFHELTVPNRLFEIAPDGKILYSQRLTFTLSCSMVLEKYPMDNQTCRFAMESYGFTTRDLIFRWNVDAEKPVDVREDLELPEFQLQFVRTGNCTAVYSTGAFTCIFAELHFKRELAYYLIQTYIPSILIVMLSWVSFWIDIHAVPARISLGLLTVLTMTTQSTGISSRLPRVSYVKAIDVWMTTCLAFVFGALIEYSIVNVLARKGEGEEELAVASRSSTSPVIAPSDETGKPNTRQVATDTETRNGSLRRRHTANEDGAAGSRLSETLKRPTWWQKLRTNRALKVDALSRLLFPAVFIAFNIAYWLYYDNKTDSRA